MAHISPFKKYLDEKFIGPADIKIASRFVTFDGTMDRFEVTIAFDGRTLVTAYMTGLGHRTEPHKWSSLYHRGQGMSQLRKAELGITTPPIPDLADVLTCLFSDASCGDESHEDYCANMGVDPDSRKGLETYLACQASGAKLRKLFRGDYTAVAEQASNH